MVMALSRILLASLGNVSAAASKCAFLCMLVFICYCRENTCGYCFVQEKVPAVPHFGCCLCL
jgi:hypothetical protein